ncbi:hypothetical protein [Fodinicola feengrottensis]|uniref:hypothetical protein n=1 Tax=Fodinicola feengrottensis TaxID=435914 RepID=UPI0024425A1F|nr:hypothetical protein [Fodinicola feengrottensis]
MLEELDRYGRADADTALAAVEALDKVISYTQAMQMRFMDRFHQRPTRRRCTLLQIRGR